MFKAKQIVENKFWILETDEGDKIGTLSIKNDKINVVIGDKTESFDNMDDAVSKHEVVFTKRMRETKQGTDNEVYGFTTSTQPHNALWNVQMKLPIYTKTNKSNSYHCAGFYIIRFSTGWVKSYCPKLITLQRYDYKGPFKSKLEMLEQLRLANETA